MIALGEKIKIEGDESFWIICDIDPMQEIFVIKRETDGAVGHVHISDLTKKSREMVRSLDEN